MAEPILQGVPGLRMREVATAGKSATAMVHVIVVVEVPGVAVGHTADAGFSVVVQVPEVAAVLMV